MPEQGQIATVEQAPLPTNVTVRHLRLLNQETHETEPFVQLIFSTPGGIQVYFLPAESIEKLSKMLLHNARLAKTGIEVVRSFEGNGQGAKGH